MEVSNADRVVFPEVARTKGDVVRYVEAIAARLFPHVEGRLLSIKRYPKGLAAPGFFQKNVPAHYPASVERVSVPRSREASRRHAKGKAGEAPSDVTVYPVLRDPADLAFLANQNAIELHVPTSRAESPARPDRIVLDLDPPAGEVLRVQRAAHLVREAIGRFGLEGVPVATGSKGFHVVCPIAPTVDGDVLAATLQKLGLLLEAEHPEELTNAFRIAERGKRVFVDWLRNRTLATVIAPFSLRARPRAPVAVPITWTELDTTAPDAFTIDDADALAAREDPLLAAATKPGDAGPFVAAVDAAFEAKGLQLVPFDRFRSR